MNAAEFALLGLQTASVDLLQRELLTRRMVTRDVQIILLDASPTEVRDDR